MAKKKVLLMGKAHSGKTSMRSIIFANYLARDTTRLSPTLDVEHHHVRFLGDLVLNLWDCGGQDAFYESYFERDRETIFRSVELLIYVFDIESETAEKDFIHFNGVLEAIEENSPDARIFVLIHKMDLVAEFDRYHILEERKNLIYDSCTHYGFENFHCYGTSIWDETLYKAWSEIVTNLIPNINLLQTHLLTFCKTCDADEVVLFERATFLVISHAQLTETTTTTTTDDYITYEHDKNNGVVAVVPSPATTNDGVAVGVGLPLSESNQNNHLNDGDNSTTNVDTSTVLTTTTTATTTTTTISTNEKIVQKSSLQLQQQQSQRPQRQRYKHVKRIEHFDPHRFEKISNIVKQFKLSCGKAQSQFQCMEVKNSRFMACIDAFTANTYIMVIVSDPNVHSAATLLNIQNARDHFEKFIPRI